MDTGFTDVTTPPPAVCKALALPLSRYHLSFLANSSSILLEVYIATQQWDGEERNVKVLALKGAPRFISVGIATIEHLRKLSASKIGLYM